MSETTRPTVQERHNILDPMKNPHAVSLGRQGGLAGGPARAKILSPERRSKIARGAAITRWKRQRRSLPYLDMTIRSNRKIMARRLVKVAGGDEATVEQILFMSTLAPWERLARGRRRSRLCKTGGKATC